MFTATTGKSVKSAPFLRSDGLALKAVGSMLPGKRQEELFVLGNGTKMKRVWDLTHLKG